MPAHTLSKLTPLATALLMRNAIRPKLSLTGLGMALSMTLASQVQAQEWNLNIPAQPLDKALQVFAEQANVQLLYNPGDVQGLRSTAVNGHYGLDQSINLLLRGTGVSYQITGNTLTLIVPSPGEAMELSSVTISGKAPGSITEGTGSYTTVSTSSSTRLNLRPQETPQSVTVLTRQRLEDQKLDNLADALDATTGVTVQALAYGGDSPQIFSRGSTINNFQIDGVPTASSMANYLQDTAMYDRIEVVRGATGIMSGFGKPSATINMIRKRPTFAPQISLTAEAGNWQRYGSGMDVSGPLNDNETIRGRMVVDYKHQHGWTDNYEQEKTSIYGISELDLSDDTLITLGFSHITRDTNSPTSIFPMLYSNGEKIDTNASDNDTPTWAYYDHDLSTAFTSIEHKFASGWSLKSELTYSRYHYKALNGSIQGSVDKATGAGSRLLSPYWVNTTEQENLDTYVTGPFSLFGREHELIGGVTLTQLETNGPTYTMTPSTYSIPNYLTWVEDTPKPTYNKTAKSNGNEYQYSAYISSRLHLTDRASLLLGSRFTDWRKNNETESLTTGRTTKTSSRETGIFTPYAGIVYALDDTWSLYASYTSIFQPQDSFINQYIANPAPEEGTSYEAGIKASFNEGRLNSSLSVFKTNQDNLAVWVNTNAAYEMFNNTTTEGVELEFNGELAEGWNLSSGYVYSVTHNDEGERIITRAPRHSWKTFTTYRLQGALNKVTIGGGFNWQSKTSENLQLIQEGSYALFNLMGRYDISQNLSVSANINNLFDKEYAYVGSRGSYGTPRNFMTSLKYTY
ncbi:ferripyoverdine/pyocin S3 receptor FpvA [Pseudomonas sp. 3A(2025)]